MEAIIVPCTQEKIWDAEPNAGAVLAKDAYTKHAFIEWRRYAERSGSPWFILSTKYGLLRPDQPIANYNVPISSAVNDRALLEQLRAQGQELALGSFERIVLLDWEKFEPLVRAAAGEQAQCVLRKVVY